MTQDAADDSDRLVDAVADAHARGAPLTIVGSGSKAFLLPTRDQIEGNVLSVSEHTGVVEYRSDELVVTVRAGTPLRELEQLLARQDQMLPFDPPTFAGGGTVGGALAAGLSGPGRPWWGSLRDALLGVELVNGLGERMRFGGQVMKNVAGFDVSRLQSGAFGTLGVILSASFRLRPRPVAESTTVLELSAADSLRLVRRLARQALPVSATCADGRVLRIRLSGAESTVLDGCRRIGGNVAQDDGFWLALRDHQLPALRTQGTLWRLGLPPATAPVAGEAIVEWAGALRWLVSENDDVPELAHSLGGWAAPFTSGFAARTPAGMDEPMRRYHRRIKAAFDPADILNRGLVATHAN